MADLSQLLYGSQQMPQEAPEGVRVPWQNLPPQKADEARVRAGEQARKKIDENSAVLSKIGSVVNQMEQFNELNKRNRTGEFYSGILPQFLTGSAEQTMDTITSDLAPNKKIEGAGSTSDTDIRLYLKSVPSIEKKGSVNQSILNQTNKQYDKAKAKLNFLQDYYDQYGHLNGADTIWEKNYANQFKPKTIKQGTSNKIIQEADNILLKGNQYGNSRTVR